MSNLTGRAPYQKGQNTKSKPLRNAARGATCTLRIPGVCNGDSATTAGDHLRMFGTAGMGHKPLDLFLLDGCSSCHKALDDRSRWAELGFGYDDILRALIESQTRRFLAGLITIPETH